MDLRIKMPKKFKKSLRQRFDLRRAALRDSSYFLSKVYAIKGECEICNYYDGDCEKCPFGKFAEKDIEGCTRWIEKVIGKHHFYVFAKDVLWLKRNNKKAREEIKEFKRKAEKLIQWI